MSRPSRTGKRMAAMLFGVVTAALIGATAAAPAHAQPP